MASITEIIDKYFEDNQDIELLARKYGIKREKLEVDPFNQYICLNDKYMQRYLIAYEFSYSDKAREILKNQKLDISGILEWMDSHYDKAVDYQFNKLFSSNSNIKFNFVKLSRLIPGVLNLCRFEPSSHSSEEIKKYGNHYATLFSNVEWDDKEYEIYAKASFMAKNDNDEVFNRGVRDVLSDNSLELLDVLNTLKKAQNTINSFNDDKIGDQDKLLLEELDYIKSDNYIISILYNRLVNEGNLEKLENNTDEYFLSNEIINYKNEIEVEPIIFNPITEDETREEIFDEVRPINPEIVNDVNAALSLYNHLGPESESAKIIDTVVEYIFGLGKSIYDDDSDEFNKEIIVNSILEALKNNGIETFDFFVQYSVDKFLANSNNDVIDVSYEENVEEDIKDEENIIEDTDFDNEIVEDLKGILTEKGIEKLSNGTKEQRQNVILSLFLTLKGTGVGRYNIKSDEFDQDKLIDSFYKVLKDYGIERDLIKKTILAHCVNNAVKNINVSEIFNKLPEENVKDNLDNLYDNSDESNKAELNKSILEEFSKLMNGAMYGSVRDIELIEKQFNIFCSEHGINYTDEFINSLPEIIRDKYKSPIIERENSKPQIGQIFKIVKRYIPTTSVKTQKRLCATLAGVGIMSFLFMTIVRLKSTDEATKNCANTFERLLNSEMITNIFGNIWSYFSSIAASIGGGIGYIAIDEKENKSRRK